MGRVMTQRERDKLRYEQTKADPVLWAAFLERKRRERKARVGYEAKRKSKWRAKNEAHAKTIAAANHAVETALKRGHLTKPKKCSECGSATNIQSHHWSYAEDHWLDVVWLCQRCHSKKHFPGEANATR